MEIKKFEEIYSSIKNYTIAHQTKLTDFTVGSIVMSIAEAVARVIESLYLNAKQGFSSFMRGLPYSVFGYKALPGNRASGRVVFSLVESATYDTIIPNGIALSAGSLTFITTDRVVIPAGESSSAPVNITADDIGSAYNLPAGAISIINGQVPNNVDSVTNPEETVGGSDKELWNNFVIRFNDYIVGLQRTNRSGIRSLIVDSGTARSVGIVEHFPAKNDIYNATIYVEDGSGDMPPIGLDAVKLLVEGDDTAEHPANKAVGLNYWYAPPVKIPLSFAIVCAINAKKAVDISVDELKSQLVQVLREYVNALKIGESFYPANVITLFKSNGYINDVMINSPAEILLDKEDSIFRFNSADINFILS
ncbi:MAG: hypothetical protein Ta2A_13690 [Treponemataceae bacterium]|nr:MAG: hypothetical protein Ta2A_13690 [Treponemataceae bacterium]